MSKTAKIQNVLANYMAQGIFYHALFWIVFYFFLIIVDHSDVHLFIKMVNKLIRVLIYVVVVYFNLLYLFPQYLKKNNYFEYLVWIILILLCITPIEVFVDLIISKEAITWKSLFDPLKNSKFFMGNFFMAFSSTLYKIINDWSMHHIEKSELKKQTLQSELNFLKSQINPHFLFNTLNSIFALTLKKSDDAPEMVLRLSEMMRYMLYDCNSPRVDLNKEINYLNNYLELEKLRHSPRIDINLSVTGEINDQQIAPLLFIPFVENSFKHGADGNVKNGYVNIDIDVKEELLNVKVCNSKIDKKINKDKKSGGIGLINVKRRLALIYPNKHELYFSNDDAEFIVNLELEL